ncbi:MAG: hypothetical protein WD335_03345 [Candidatus Paceibacterota bacterium]
MYNKQKAEALLEMYDEAREKNLSGAEAGVQFQYSKNKFYFTADGMEYTITLKNLVDNLDGDGFDTVNKIKAWAEAKYDD